MGTWLRVPRLITRRSTSKRQSSYRPALQSLEERCLLDGSPPIVPNLTPVPQLVANTIPPNGDVNPYGVAFVPHNFARGGPLLPGDVIVSNFNASSNVQGTGNTIVSIDPTGAQSVFFQGSGLGLTTALGVLRRGFVLVGNLPTDVNGVPQQGSLLILDRFGNVAETLSDPSLLNGPWDLAVNDQGERAQVFVSNVLSGTVTRIDLRVPNDGSMPVVQSETQIASGYLIRPDPAALVVGPTGLAYNREQDILYVASTGDNAIFSIANARHTSTDGGMGSLVYQDSVHLHGPLGLVQAPNGDLVSTQGDAVNPDPTQPSEIVECTTQGQFVAQVPIDSSGLQGGAFGIALASHDDQIKFAAVNDINNTLQVWNISTGDDSHPGRERGDGAKGGVTGEVSWHSTLMGTRGVHEGGVAQSHVSFSHHSNQVEAKLVGPVKGSENGLDSATFGAVAKRAQRANDGAATELFFTDWGTRWER